MMSFKIKDNRQNNFEETKEDKVKVHSTNRG